jgi:hypothetical protein
VNDFSALLSLAHLVGLALGVGSATAKLALLLRCNADPAFVPAFVEVARPITRLIIVGLALLTLSGIGWLLLGYPFGPLLVVKIVLVAAIWVLGPVIDNVVEPRFRRLAPALGEAATTPFLQSQRRHLAIEIVATLLFYVIVVLWVLG